MSQSSSTSLPKAEMGATGYTPGEAAAILTEAGYAVTAKQIRRAIRKDQVKANQVSGRWYISRKSVQALLKASAAAAVPTPEKEAPAEAS